ncbi:glycosyltransferase family 2 protein [Acidovorax sp. NCPPB 3576]|uniref:glycosyltransferase family 2 protein n=1 Tax=Acidovorax sp. NCPPB 3576 TaxID=2940488 RepID=UPI002349306E|nr:glycosyltransferase [Acidovorax sp. NCPPB 3576]WCM89181.1 glycosyltransferase [Acidovorax sp. NCPPB 3576]
MTSHINAERGLAVSLISHGHGPWVQALLQDLARWCGGSVSRVVLTLNLPEAEPQAPAEGWPFLLEIRRNAAPLGFGANHNRALRGAREPMVCVLNPDVSLLGGNPFPALCEAAWPADVGCAYPEQVDGRGQPQDSERELPSPAALWRRRVLRRREHRVDWVNAAFLVMRRAVWEALEGFDERYFMYCEDVDLSLRMRLKGLRLQKGAARVGHVGQRDSQRRFSYLAWHVRSLWRLWRSPVYRQARSLLPGGTGGPHTIGAP